MGVAVDVDLHAQVKSAASLRGLNLEAAYDAALRRWLTDGKPSPGLSPHNAKYHLMLEEILERRDDISDALKETVSVVKRLLEIHGDGAVRGHRKK